MQYGQPGDTYMLRIGYGEEILQSLEQLCEQEGIRPAQVSAVDRAIAGVYGLHEKRVRHRISIFMTNRNTKQGRCTDDMDYVPVSSVFQ